tara:strand:- start:149 stop:337 length:189 start_codon:yes stop_codon:yes gene_type:complete
VAEAAVNPALVLEALLEQEVVEQEVQVQLMVLLGRIIPVVAEEAVVNHLHLLETTLAVKVLL